MLNKAFSSNVPNLAGPSAQPLGAGGIGANQVQSPVLGGGPPQPSVPPTFDDSQIPPYLNYAFDHLSQGVNRRKNSIEAAGNLALQGIDVNTAVAMKEDQEIQREAERLALATQGMDTTEVDKALSQYEQHLGMRPKAPEMPDLESPNIAQALAALAGILFEPENAGLIASLPFQHQQALRMERYKKALADQEDAEKTWEERSKALEEAVKLKRDIAKADMEERNKDERQRQEQAYKTAETEKERRFKEEQEGKKQEFELKKFELEQQEAKDKAGREAKEKARGQLEKDMRETDDPATVDEIAKILGDVPETVVNVYRNQARRRAEVRAQKDNFEREKFEFQKNKEKYDRTEAEDDDRYRESQDNRTYNLQRDRFNYEKGKAGGGGASKALDGLRDRERKARNKYDGTLNAWRNLKQLEKETPEEFAERKSKAREKVDEAKGELDSISRDVKEYGNAHKNLSSFAQQYGFTVTAGKEKGHNKGSLHGDGLAIDVRTRDKTPEQVAAFVKAAKAAGITVRDERTRPNGQEKWTGPHLHLEGNPKTTKPKVAKKTKNRTYNGLG